MYMKCLYCSKELTNPKARFCNDSERMRYKRKSKSEQETRTLVIENPNKLKPEQVKIETVVNPNKELLFTNEPMDKRIKMFYEVYPDATFVPNWVENGFNSKNEALASAIRDINESKAVKNSGLI